MKKVIIFGAAIITLASFSFFKTTDQPPLRKIGKGLYSSESSTALKPADLEKLKAELSRQYGIKNFNTTTTVHYTNVSGPKSINKGVSFAEARVTSSVFQQTMLTNGDEEVVQACIYSKCPGSSTTGELVQVLSTYSVN